MSPQPARIATADIKQELRRVEHECFSEAYRAEWEEYAAGVWAEMAAEDERTARLEDENARLRSCLAATERRMRLMLACGAPVLLVLVWVVLR